MVASPSLSLSVASLFVKWPSLPSAHARNQGEQAAKCPRATNLRQLSLQFPARVRYSVKWLIAGGSYQREGVTDEILGAWDRGIDGPGRWLEQLRGRWRIALTLVYLLIASAVGLLIWRQSQLRGLPDIGDPFNPEPLLTLTVPEDRDAFTLYRKAAAKFVHNEVIEKRLLNRPFTWPKGDENATAFLEANAEGWNSGGEGASGPMRCTCRSAN